MIIVTGTKRSGTSMWMQLLEAAGIPVIGEAFPLEWGETLRAANPEGFFESILRRGIYWETNPHPVNGAYIDPDKSRHYAVKVFIPGLIRTDRAFMHRVIGTMRHWREYDASLRRLYSMGDASRKERGKEGPAPVEYTDDRMDPILEWWAENFSLVSDLVIRRYPMHLTAYEETLRDPERVVTEAFEWLGKGDAKRAVATVKPDVRTQEGGGDRIEIDAEPHITQTFDDLYELVLKRKPLEPAFIEKLNTTNEKLLPRYQAAARAVEQRRRQNREKRQQ